MSFPSLRLKSAMSLGGLTPRELAMRTWAKFNDNEIMTRASAISFYAMLACVPFLALLITVVVGLLPDLTENLGPAAKVTGSTVEELQTTLRSLFPKEAYAVVEDQIRRLQEELKQRPPIGLLLLGLGVTLWLASSLFTAIIDAMNRIYGVTETRSIVRIRLTAILMTIIQAAILLSALIATVAGPEIVRWVGIRGHAATITLSIQWAVVVLMVLFSFALTFFVGPDSKQRWEWITPGSLLGAAMFLLFTFGFRIYVQNFANYNKTYGSLGGVMVLLFWFWVSSLLLLTAGQVNKLIEDQSPVGRRVGQKAESSRPPDFEALTPQPSERP